MLARIRKLQISIFTKLLLILIATWMVINLLFGVFHPYFRDTFQRPIHNNAVQYVNHLIDDALIGGSVRFSAG